jgi:ABC-2 type transport system permease protein
VTTARSTRVIQPSTLRSAWLVAEREITTRLRSKSFLISTAILLLIVLASIVIGAFMAANDEDTEVAVVGDVSIGQVDGIDATEVATLEEAEALVRDGDVDAALVADDSTPIGIKIVANTNVPDDLVALLSVAPPVELLDQNAPDPTLTYLVALGFGLVFFASAMTFGMTIAQSVVEEKQTRVIEILIAAIPTRALLAGKVLGTSILAFGQIALIIAVAIVAMTVTGQETLLVGLGAPLVWFVVFFTIGFVLLAALFAATGAMVSRQEDIGATTTPVTMLIMLPYFLVIFFNDNPLIIGIMSYVPFSAPVAMPLRLFLGSAQWWEPLVSLAILVATTIGLIALGARIYENSLLKLGARVTLKEALTR